MNPQEETQLKEILSLLSKNPELRSAIEKSEPEIMAKIAGALLSSWWPTSFSRQCLMFIFFLLGSVGLLSGNFLFLISIAISLSFSPRLVGELLALVGKISRVLKNK